eukprot:TRINITY_DN198_c0_g1_i1.p1 TRINITY_DN198_c0_g1~~TRINITY_DN198_c0_g1_i1.p1  ORF type:complete len:885 (+),score=226.07 TRINITY_DN198_c0_g1_i1:95-2749(+)
MKFLHRHSKTAQPATVITPAPAVIAPTAAPVSYFAVPPISSSSQPVLLGQPTNLQYVGTTRTVPIVQNVPIVQTVPVVTQPAIQPMAATAYPTVVYTAPATTTYLTPSYSKLLRRIHLLNEAMFRIQRERVAAEELDLKGMRVLQEIQVVLSDIEAFLITKNGDMKFQQLADHFFTFAGELRNDRELATFVSSWKAARAGHASNVDGVINNVSVLFHDIKSSRNIYSCANEALKLVESILDSDGEHDLEGQKKKVYDELIELLKGIGENPRWKAISGQGKETVQGLNSRARQTMSNRPHLRLKQRQSFEILMYDVRRAIEVLMVDHDGVTVDKFFEAVEKFVTDCLNTPAYHQFVHDAKEAGSEIMEDPDILQDPATRELLWNLWNTFVEMISEVKKHPSFQEAFEHAKHIMKSLMKDPYAHNILSHAKILLKDIQHNEEGRLIDFSLVPQFKHILVPLLLESFREVRIPPIQGVTPDKKLKYHISGIVLSSIEMLPENIKIEATYRMNTDPLRLDVHEKDIILWVEADKVRARVTGAAWNYERLTFPRIGDSGLASVILGGHGARVGAKIRIHKQGNEHVMQVIDSYCIISRLDLAMYECKYSVLYKMAHKHLVKQLKSVIELGVAEKLTQLVTGLDRSVLKTIMKIQIAKDVVIKTAKAGKKKLIKKKNSSASNKSTEKKSKKEQLMGLATSSSTKRRGLSLIKKARKTAQSKAEKRPSLEELNHAPPPPPAGLASEYPPLVAPSTHEPLPPLVAPNTHQALPPLVAPTQQPLPPLASPSTIPQAPLATSTPVTPLTPSAIPSSPASVPTAPLTPLADWSSTNALSRSDHQGTHVVSTISSTPDHGTLTSTSTNAPADLVNLQKNSTTAPVPLTSGSGIASI